MIASQSRAQNQGPRCVEAVEWNRPASTRSSLVPKRAHDSEWTLPTCVPAAIHR